MESGIANSYDSSQKTAQVALVNTLALFVGVIKTAHAHAQLFTFVSLSGSVPNLNLERELRCTMVMR